MSWERASGGDSAWRRPLLFGVIIASLGWRASGAIPDDPVILSAALVQNGKAVAIRTARGIQILQPDRSDAGFAGYDPPIVAGDKRAVAWIVENSESSDASYPEPTGVWLFAHGRLARGVGCDGGGGRPFDIYFSKGGRTLVLVCEFAHGPPSKHEVSFDTATGRCLLDHDLQNGKQQPCAE